MEAGKHNVRQLFQRDIRYTIPTFQRPYVWGKESQWEPLWTDVRNTAERFAEAILESNGDLNLAEQAAGTHFLGAIVLQQIPTPVAELETRAVIDGQQRMTTLQILLDAAQEVFEVEEFRLPAKQLRRLVLNDEDFAQGDHLFKLWPTLSDRDAFRAAMTNGPTRREFEQHRIVRAHEFFKFQISEWLNSALEEERDTWANALNITLMGLLEIVVIDLRTGDDAYIIFETLNARGTPLLASDLVKNYVLQQAAAANLNTEQLHSKYWSEMETKWWRREIAQGRIVRPRLDIFLNYWLVARTRSEVKSHNVFPEFRTYAESADSNIVDIIKDVQHVAKAYRKLDELPEFSFEGTFLYRWNTVQAGVVTPLLLELFSASADLLEEARLRRSLKAIESFLVRRMVCRMTTKDYNRLFLELISRLEGNIGRADEVIITYLRDQTAESRLWPDDERLANSLLELPLYRLLTRGRLRMVLEGLEEAMRSDRAEEHFVNRQKLTIEHIMPQKWQEHWPLPAVDEPEEYYRRVSRRDRIVHTIGNLTLLTNKLNPALSNSGWESKTEGIQAHSVLHLNKRLLEGWGSGDFSEPEIAERSKQLARLACKVWPLTEVG